MAYKSVQDIIFSYYFISVLDNFYGPEINKDEARKAYINSLIKYNNTRYLWGGENIFGIDCSGLARKGLINANFKIGITKLNPKYVKKAFFYGRMIFP